ncbi:MAG: alpha/beta hydrolase [bacterium]|nr:alpha/beta hydrolase [bacterium]
MATNYVLEQTRKAGHVRELVFAGDGVALSGQIEYPSTPPGPKAVYPLVFILPHSGGNTRDAFEHYARCALRCGYAVFRWDKRGTGRSGAGGRGSTTQDAVNAYEIALEQPMVERDAVIILAQSEGTLMLGSSYGLFARLQRPRGVILAGNMLDEKAILALDTQIQIILGTEDWKDPRVYAYNAAKAHNTAYKYGAAFSIVQNANRRLLVERSGEMVFHAAAEQIMADWLLSLCPASV